MNSSLGVWLATAFLMVICGCVHKSGPPLKEEDEKKPSNQGQPFYLVDLQVDRLAVKEGAKLLFDEAPVGETLGETRRARGYLSLTDNGLCRCEVRAAETVLGLGGSVSEQRYDLMIFFGKVEVGDTRAIAASGDRGGRSYMGPVSELHLKWLSPTEVEVQAHSAGQRQAYLYRFERRALKEHDVRMPY